MRRKICAIGNSRGVSLPVEALERLKLAVGSEVDVKLDEENGRIVIEPVQRVDFPEGVDADFVSSAGPRLSAATGRRHASRPCLAQQEKGTRHRMLDAFFDLESEQEG